MSSHIVLTYLSLSHLIYSAVKVVAATTLLAQLLRPVLTDFWVVHHLGDDLHEALLTRGSEPHMDLASSSLSFIFYQLRALSSLLDSLPVYYFADILIFKIQ